MDRTHQMSSLFEGYPVIGDLLLWHAPYLSEPPLLGQVSTLAMPPASLKSGPTFIYQYQVIINVLRKLGYAFFLAWRSGGCLLDTLQFLWGVLVRRHLEAGDEADEIRRGERDPQE